MTVTPSTTPVDTMVMTDIKLSASSATTPSNPTVASPSTAASIVSQQPSAKVSPRTAEQEDTMRLQGGGECCRLIFCCPCIECLICIVTLGCVRPHIDCGC